MTPMDESAPSSEPAPSRRRAKVVSALRVATLAALLAVAWVVADQTGLRDSMTQDGIREMTSDAGALGALAYLVSFAIGQLAQLPGAAFVLAARVAYGPVIGFLLAYTGALLSVSVSFFFVRGVGGRALTGLKWKWAQRVLARLDARPVLTIIVLRTLFALSPPLNYALAMSSTRFRHYFAGSAIGLVAPIAVYVFLSDFLLSCATGIL
ncbi:MAG: VTT domain-containing protein [Sandaracinaceae bacterium]|nr:VTT domain-containing protein [Sandaracinaceae bacterium]